MAYTLTDYVAFCVRQTHIDSRTTSSSGGEGSGANDRGENLESNDDRLREPTRYLPGTPQKISLMGERFEAGLPIFLPGDVRLVG